MSLPCATTHLVSLYGKACKKALLTEFPKKTFQVDNIIGNRYAYAGRWVFIAENSLRGTNYAEILNHYYHNMVAKVIDPLDSEQEALYAVQQAQLSATVHADLNRLAQLLIQDPSGFSVINHVLSSKGFVDARKFQNPYHALIEHVIQLGAERYKKYYRAANLLSTI